MLRKKCLLSWKIFAWVPGLIWLFGCAVQPTEVVEPPISVPPVPIVTEKNPDFRDILLELHNKERLQRGCTILNRNNDLDNYAQKWANHMASQNKLYHSNIQVLLNDWSSAGENIAWNQSNEEKVVIAWMNSSGHRANILKRSFRAAGFGVAFNKKGEPYWCVVFAS